MMEAITIISSRWVLLHINFFPLEEENQSSKSEPKALLLGGKDFLQQMKKEEAIYAIFYKLKSESDNTVISDLPLEIRNMLVHYQDIVVHDFPNVFPCKRII